MSLYSGPYITLSPPPTAGPLPIIERANLNTPYSGGGGGGGPSTIGPNPVVSSITTNAGWTVGIPSTFDIVGAGIGLAIGGNNVQTIALGCSTLTEVDIIGPNLNEVVINGGKLSVINCFSGRAATETASMSLNISTQNGHIYTLLPDAGTFLEIQSDSRYPTPSQPTCGSLELGALPDGRSYVGAALGYSAFGLSTLMLLGDGVNISSLNVSSINGAAPGGGGGAPPAVVSTISSLINVSTINVGSPGLVTIAGGVSVLDYVGAGSISTGSIVSIAPGGSVSVQSLNTSSITSAAPQINIAAPTSISSLSVSSINGAAPGGGSAPFFSSIKIPGTLSTFVCDPGATTILVPFSTTAGHVYSATAYIRAQVFEVAGNGDTVYTEILDNAIGNEAFGNWSAQIVSTITGGGSLQYVGGTVTWKAGGTGAALSCVPSVSTSLKIDALNLIDFGAV